MSRRTSLARCNTLDFVNKAVCPAGGWKRRARIVLCPQNDTGQLLLGCAYPKPCIAERWYKITVILCLDTPNTCVYCKMIPPFHKRPWNCVTCESFSFSFSVLMELLRSLFSSSCLVILFSIIIRYRTPYGGRILQFVWINFTVMVEEFCNFFHLSCSLESDFSKIKWWRKIRDRWICID